MKVYYKTVLQGAQANPQRHSPSDVDGVEELDQRTEFCCTEMREAWGDWTRFGDDDRRIAAVHLWHRSSYGGTDDESPIKFCPWCGIAIVIEEVARNIWVARSSIIPARPAKTAIEYVQEPVGANLGNSVGTGRQRKEEAP